MLRKTNGNTLAQFITIVQTLKECMIQLGKKCYLVSWFSWEYPV